MAESQPIRSPVSRECGSCRVCCVQLPIPAGVVAADAKPAKVACGCLCSAGCNVYANRPRLCADFQCAWLSGRSWPDAWRPDHSGLLCLRERVRGQPMAAVYEVLPDALHRARTSAILVELQRTTTIVVVIDSEGRRHGLMGWWSSDGPHARLPAPHFHLLRSSTAQPQWCDSAEAQRGIGI
jgi:hypothetical protein